MNNNNAVIANELKLKRTLKARHLNMIALGGSIGTGLFLASGGSIAQAGPGGALLAYTLIGVMVYFLMTSLGEMSTNMPTSGSFSEYAKRYFDKSLGFASGWNYWFNWAITLASELAAAAVIMKFWFPDVPGWIFSLLFLFIILALNIISVRGFGESEYVFSSIKVVTVIVFIIVGAGIILGLWGGEGHTVGFENWFIGDAPFHDGVLGVLAIMMIAGYSFQGTELLGVAAGETDDPKKNVPKAVRQIFWRIVLFYMLSIFVIGTLIPYTNENLSLEDVAVSPYTLVFSQIGIPAAASVLNAVILIAVLSAGNSGTYASTRMLFALAEQGEAPKVFSQVSKNGVPVPALLLTIAVGGASCLSSIVGDGEMYNLLLNISALAGFITWFIIALSHYRFRKAFIKQGKSLDDLPFKAKFFPVGQLLALFLCGFVIIGQGFSAFSDTGVDWNALLSTYIGVPVFFVVYFAHKFKHKTRLVRLEEMDLDGIDNILK
ncbi:MAG: amino acid permease [Candidatus Ancillula sp.]|jgi:lysine-specific permease|nr:amino acid permease [Candidatus Ancillula sp.]